MNQTISTPIGSKDSPLWMQNQFQAAMLRIFEKRCRYDGETRTFLQAFHQHHPEAPKPVYRAPLENVLRQA